MAELNSKIEHEYELYKDLYSTFMGQTKCSGWMKVHFERFDHQIYSASIQIEYESPVQNRISLKVAHTQLAVKARYGLERSYDFPQYLTSIANELIAGIASATGFDTPGCQEMFKFSVDDLKVLDVTFNDNADDDNARYPVSLNPSENRADGTKYCDVEKFPKWQSVQKI